MFEHKLKHDLFFHIDVFEKHSGFKSDSSVKLSQDEVRKYYNNVYSLF